MLRKMATVVRRDRKSLLLAALFSLALAAGAFHPEVAGEGLALRQLALAGVMFLLLSAGFSLFAAGVRQHVAREKGELAEGEFSSRLLTLFVVYKEAVKTVVGVSLTLAWLAGLLFIQEQLGGQLFLVPVGAGLGYSLLLFLSAYLFAAFMDHIPYPGGR